jgi:hypothetical protein
MTWPPERIQSQPAGRFSLRHRDASSQCVIPLPARERIKVRNPYTARYFARDSGFCLCSEPRPRHYRSVRCHHRARQRLSSPSVIIQTMNSPTARAGALTESSQSHPCELIMRRQLHRPAILRSNRSANAFPQSHAPTAEEMEEKVKCQQNSPIRPILDFRTMFLCLRVSPLLQTIEMTGC